MTEANLNSYQEGLELAEAGRYQEALCHIEEYLQACPEDSEALNDAGAILHCLGRSAEAVERFTRARTLRGDCAEIIWNLAEAHLAEGRANEAMQLFDDMERMGILNLDIVNRTANVFLKQSNKADAVEMLLRSLQLSPEQQVLKPMIEVIRSKRPKVLFVCESGGEVFSFDIREFFERRFPLEFYEGQNSNEVYELMRRSDICWFDGCTSTAMEVLQRPRVCKNIVKLNQLEPYMNWSSQVKCENIDTLVVLSGSVVGDILIEQMSETSSGALVVTIPRGVNLERFKLVKGRFASEMKTNNDAGRRGKNIACVGPLSIADNPMFLLQCMQKLHYIDSEYRLFFTGDFQGAVLEEYIRHTVQALELRDVVFFDLPISSHEDLNSWLQDKHYIVSCGISDAGGKGLLEGMACGLRPLIHNFPGASDVFPSEFLFNISEEFCRHILSETYQPERYRGFVEEHYSLQEQLRTIGSTLRQLEAEIELQRTGTEFSSCDDSTVGFRGPGRVSHEMV
jgi:hypothetical protein